MKTAVRGLGEVVLRVCDMAAMRDFYRDVIRLEVMSSDTQFTFLRIAEGYKGHTQVLALFAENLPANAEDVYLEPIDSPKSSLHHFALEIDLEDYESELARLTELGLTATKREFAWVSWRSFFIRDPENNVVEFVAYDAALTE